MGAVVYQSLMNVRTPGQADRLSKLDLDSLFACYLVTGRSHPNFGFWPLHSGLFLPNFASGPLFFFFFMVHFTRFLSPLPLSHVLHYPVFNRSVWCSLSLLFLVGTGVWCLRMQTQFQFNMCDVDGPVLPSLSFGSIRVEVMTVRFNPSISV